MRVNERMKKWISMALCLCMLVQNAPVVALAADADCTHHAEHTAECGYVAAVEGVPCAHEHSESCYAIQECLHTCGDECADGCGHECSVMECHRLLCAHAEGGHDDSCGYAEAVAAHECHYECAECAQAAAAAETEVAPETTAAATEAAPETTEAAEETTVAATEPVVETTEAATEPVVETTAAATEPEEEVTEAVTEAVTNPAMQDGAADKDTGTDTAVVYADCTCTVKCGETAYTECVVCAADPTACAAEESPVVSVTIGGNTNYHLTLADAVAAVASCTADDNAVVKMEQDVDLGSECLQIFSGVFTIDLNGKTLSSTHETYGTLYLDDGSVTIMDSSVDQTGKITGSYAGVEPRGDAVTIDGGTISGEQYGVYAFDGIVTINGGNINGNIGLYYLSQDGTVYINGGTISGTNTGVGFAGYIAATITGGSISGYYEDIYTSEENVELTLAEGKTEGATFPGGLTVGGTTLDVVLGEGAAYWQGDKMLTNVTGTSIDGDVTVKAVCDHANAAYPEITDTQHKIVCSCGYEVTGEHTTVKDENKVNCQHGDICDLCGEPYGEPTAHTFGEDYKCTLCGADCPHGSYTGGYCADCGKVATYTVSLYADGTGYTYGAQILSVNGAAVTPGETVTVEHGKDLTVVLRNGLSTLVEKVQVWKVRIVHDYTNVDYPIADSDADGETTESYDWYDISTGTLTIPGEYITGDVWIDAEAYVRNFVDLNGAALVIPEEMLGQMTEEEVIAMLKEQFGYDPESNSLTVDEPYDAENKGEATGAFGPTVQGLFGIEGYVFTGFTDSEGNTYPADYEVYVFVKDVVLTAQWECVHAAFSCEDNGDGTHSDICSVCGAVLETADHAYENGYCADCGKAATYNVWWQNNMGLLTGTVESFTYGQDLRAEVTIPENTHLRINGVYVDDGSSDEVQYTYENGVLTILADDLPAADIVIDDYHYVNVKFDANGGTITQEGEFPQEFIVDFAQDGSYLILTFDIGINTVAPGFSSNFSANREGWTWTQKWMDAQGNVYDIGPDADAPLMADITLTAQWECAGHVGGTATCTAPAICTTCQQPYGEKDPDNHTSTEFTYDDDRAYDAKHNVLHACCGAFVREEDCTGYFDCFGIEGSTQNRVMTMIFYCDKGHEVDRFESEDTSDHVDGTCQTPATETFNFKFDLSDKYENIWERFTLDTDSAEWLNYTWDAETATATYVWTSAKDPDNHAEAIRYENLGTEGHKAYYPCCQSADAAAAEAHDYTHDPDTHTCLCGDVEMFTVTWKLNGVVFVEELPTELTYGRNYVSIEVVSVPEGYSIRCFRDADGKELEISSGVGENLRLDVTGNMTIEVVLEPKTYTVTWTVNGEEVGTTEVKFGETIEAPAYAVPEGYTFSGWTVPETMPAENITLDATLTIKTYTITWIADGETVDTVVMEYGTYLVTEPEVPEKDGHSGTWDKTVDVVTEDVTVNAVYTPNTYYINWIADGEIHHSEAVTYGQTVTPPAYTAPEGYTFDGWDDNYFEGMTMPSFNLTITAILTPIRYTITWDMNGCTYELANMSALPEQLAYNVGGWDHQIDFAWIEAPAGHRFVKFVDGSGNELSMDDRTGSAFYTHRLWVTVSGDMTIKAVIEPRTYMATWTDGDGASYETEFTFGETITIPDNELFNDTFRETGYTLTGWEGYTEGMTMPVDGITFTAIYTPNQYTITFDSDGGTEVKPMTQAYGSAITAPAKPAKDGFHFVKWDALPETMPAEDLTVKAVWEAHSGGTETCDKGKVCACGAEYTEKLGHDYRWTGNAEAHWQVCARDESHVTTACTKALSHSYRMGDGNVIEVTQVCDCGYSGEFAEVTLSGISFPYTGKAIEPHSIAYPDSWLGEKNIVPTYSGNVDATDSATMTLGRYSLTFAITKATPKAEDFVLTLPEDLTYDGQRKAVTVVPAAGVAGMGEITVICCLPGGDQEHAVEPVDVNAYIVSVNVAEGDNYEGVANLTLGRFEITPAKATYTAPAANAVTYTGNAQALVTPGTANGGKLVYSLTENGTYTETIPTGTDAGAYTVYYKVIGDANHTDTDVQSVVVNIAKADPVIGTVGCEMALFDSTAVSDVVLTRTNTAVEGTLVLTDAELTAGEGTYNWKFTPKDGDNYNTITGTVMLTVTADVLERIEASGTLDKRAYVYGDAFSIDGLTVTAVYTSNAAEDVTASVQYGKTLSVGQTSVELSYQGKTCTVGGITVAKKQLVIESMSWEVPENAVYSGNEYTATLKGTLPAGVQVTTSGDKAADAGSYTAKAVFSLAEGYSADNYEIVNGADLTKAWGIEEKDISDAEITLGAALTFNGEAQTQAVAGVKIGDLAVTYTVSGNTGTNADDYTLTVTGNGNFKGTATKAWNIAKKDISGATITLGDELTYNGEEQTQSVAKAEIDGLTVTCTVSGNEQTNAGNYTLTVTGNGNFEGEATAQWRIAKATYDMRGVKWNYTDAFRYDGKPHMVEVVGLPVGVTVSGYTGNNAAKVGEYTAAVTFSYDADNYEAPVLADLTWKIVNEWIPNEYTVTTPNSEGWLNEEFAVTAKEDYQISATNTADGIWQNALTFSADTGNGSVTFYLRNKTTGAISLEKTESYKIDKTPATGKITIGELTGWEAFVNSISFNLFFKDMQTVTITGADALSGVQSVEYYASATAMTLEEVKAVTNWSAYNGGVNVPVEDAKQFVYFAKITDKAGNVSYLSTDGAVYDTAAPVIGIEPGTYYTTQTVIVTEANPDTLTLNGKSVTSPITLDGNKDTTYTIVAKDKVGHQVTVTVTMKAIDSLDDTIADLNENNVTSADREDIQDVLDGVNELLEDENLSQAEKDSLTDIKTKAEDLLDAIDKAADAVDTEDIQKVKDTNSTNVRLDDKEDLEKAKEDLEDALKDENKGNYTEAEQKAIQKELDRINEALRIIEQTEAVLDAIDALPKSVEPDLDAKTERAIRNTKAAYDELNDYQKSLIDQVRKKKLEKLLDALDDYRIIKGSGKKWEKGSDKSLVFTANGPDRKFEELRIDGRAVGASNYTHKDGSTIITLKASYLQTLSIGKHTIQVVYTDGATDGKDFFRICNSGSNPATGDDMNMLLFGGTMMTSLFCLAVMAMFICRKKEKNER